MSFERMIDQYTDPDEHEFMVTVIAEHTMRVVASSGDEAINLAREEMDHELRDQFTDLGASPEVEIYWAHDEVDPREDY